MIINRITVGLIPDKDIELCSSLLDVLEQLNSYLDKKIDIRYQDWHDTSEEYPDYYGTYRLLCGDDTIGLEMDINELDTVICCMLNLVEIQLKFNTNS